MRSLERISIASVFQTPAMDAIGCEKFCNNIVYNTIKYPTKVQLKI